MADARTVANEFLALAEARGDTLTPMQLLKLVYIAHGWSLGLYGNPLIDDEVQAWQYGPVIPQLYNAIRNFRSNPVEGRIPAPSRPSLDEQQQNVVEQVYNIYGRLSGPALSRLTHAANTPWALTYRSGRFGIPIPNDIIQDHYASLAETRGAIA